MDTLHLPLNKLAEFSMQNLLQYETLERASKSALYRDKWKAAGVKADEVKSYEDFSRLPFSTTKEIRRAIYELPIDEILCGKPVHWFSTTGTTGPAKWIPYGRRDIEVYLQIRDRAFHMLPAIDNRRLFTVTSPAPYIEDGLAALNMIRGVETKSGMQGVTVSLTQTQDEEVFNFVFDTKPNAMLAFPSFAARLAEIVEETAPQVAKKQFSEQKNPKNLLLYLITRVKKIKPKDLSKFNWGLFGGEPLDPYRDALTHAYGFEPYEMYTYTEFMPPSVECRMHDGMHLWLDICLPELIPEAELEKERADTAYTPKAIPIWAAKMGQRGEYVLTTFGEALPLVRYRFGDLIEVTSTEPCGCGYTHPRIKVPRRADLSTISLGAIRFAVVKLEEKLLSPTKYGQAKRWQVEVTREAYRPKLIIRLEPNSEILDCGSFEKEIAGKLTEIDMIKTGLENKILAEPQVKVESLLNRGRRATAAGSIIYEGE